MATNPLLDEINGLSPQAKQALVGAATQPAPGTPPPQAPTMQAPSHAQSVPAIGGPPPTPNVPQPGMSQMPTIPAPSAPSVKAPMGTSAGDSAELSRLKSTGSGISQIASKIEGSQFGQNHPTLGKILGYGAQIPLQALQAVGNISPITRNLEAAIPGTDIHHNLQVNRAQGAVNQDVSNEQKEAQAAAQREVPELNQAKLDLAQNKQNETEQHHQQQIQEQLRVHGYKLGEDGAIQPLDYSEMSPEQQGVHDLKASQEELANATTDLKKAQKDNIPVAQELARQRIANATKNQSIALERLGLSKATYNARYLGEDAGGNPLEGAMLSDEGKPVGSTFSANVRPTGQERNKADLANSAASQISDMKQIIQKHPTLFGPGYGQSTEFKRWIGSQDPDAQRFVAARTIAGDHLAGTFGGRSEAALNALDNALGQFKDNPKAALAGLDQLSGANKSFQKAGTVKTVGSSAQNQEPAKPSGKSVSLKDAMALPINKGKSEADVRKDIEAHGHKVAE